MSDIVLNPDSTSIWTDPHEKLEAVKSALKVHLERIQTKVLANENSMYPRKLENFSNAIYKRIQLCLNKFPIVPTKYAVDIDLATLKDNINCFYELVEYIMDYYEDFIITKVLFVNFLRCESYVYNQLLLSPDPDILTEMHIIDENFVNETLLSAEVGKTKEKSSSIRMSVDGVGHSVSLKPTFEDKPTINVISYDVESITKRLENLGVKMLDNKKK